MVSDKKQVLVELVGGLGTVPSSPPPPARDRVPGAPRVSLFSLRGFVAGLFVTFRDSPPMT